MPYKRGAEEYKAEALARLGEKFSIVIDDMDHARSSGVLANALKVDDCAPEFTLPDALGQEILLKSCWPGPVVISSIVAKLSIAVLRNENVSPGVSKT